MKRVSRSTPSAPTSPIEGQNSTFTSTKIYCIDPHQRISCPFPRWIALISTNVSIKRFKSKKSAVGVISTPTSQLQPPRVPSSRNLPILPLLFMTFFCEKLTCRRSSEVRASAIKCINVRFKGALGLLGPTTYATLSLLWCRCPEH